VSTRTASLQEAAEQQRIAAGAEAATIPWYIWCSVAAVTSALVGGQWDIAWHRSIGRDTFWTPPHVAIYLCGVLSGLACGFLILSTTLRASPEERGVSVRIWGLRGPLGAFVSAWGGATMLVSAPFDDWWHGAYGLDVKILSPPHVVLAIGVIAVQLGTLMLVLGRMNRARGAQREKLLALFLYLGGAMLASLLVVSMEYTDRVMMHSALFYRAVCLSAPVILAAIARASGYRWASTIVAAVYSAFMLALLWIFPLVPAEPKLGPVYQQVTHLIPPGFPLLILVPAVLLDLLWARSRHWKLWALAPVAGSLFLAACAAVQWPFAVFLLSPASRNYLFGTHYLDYNRPPYSYAAKNLFIPIDSTSAHFWMGMAVALAASIATVALGLGSGNWMRRLRR
jgi:hypothetical protein